jgi:hypothetical protein
LFVRIRTILYSTKDDVTLFSPARVGVFIEAHHLFKKSLFSHIFQEIQSKGRDQQSVMLTRRISKGRDQQSVMLTRRISKGEINKA